jgi:hypothetical protein
VSAEYVRRHKQRLTMVLAAMRAYRDELHAAGFTVDYVQLAEQPPDDPQQRARSFENVVGSWLERHRIVRLALWEIPGKALDARIRDMANACGVKLQLRSSPMFLCVGLARRAASRSPRVSGAGTSPPMSRARVATAKMACAARRSTIRSLASGEPTAHFTSGMASSSGPHALTRASLKGVSLTYRSPAE